jgi:C1A family cysteine protease
MNKNIMKKTYGWKPDLPDQRDFTYKVTAPIALPPKVDLRPFCPPVYDQGQLGSCTGNAIAASVQFEQLKKKDPHAFMPSRLFIYYNERVIEGTVKQDAGAMIRDGLKVVNNQGACTETTWPYVITKFANKPVAKAYTEGLKYKTKVYARVLQNLNSLKTCLASGDPFVFGFTVYQSFESNTVAKTGIVPMPATNEAVLGGHAVLCVGYDDSTQRFIVRNSWGPTWGIKGYFTFPYAYLTNNNLADDIWVIKDVNI